VQPHVQRLATRLLLRDWRSGEVTVLVIALVIAVTSATSVIFFTDRISRALENQASELLAADLRLESDHAINPEYLQEAKQRQLKTAQTVSFRSMAVAQSGGQLVEVKAVSSEYPLRGSLKISQTAFGNQTTVNYGPAPGNVWIEPRLLHGLGISMGQNLSLGALSFKVKRILRYEPDRSGEMFSIAPRVLMNWEDLPRTGLIQEGSRMRYRLLVAGTHNQVHAFRNWIETHLQSGERVEDVRNARQEVRLALDRGQQFLGLAATVSIVLAFIAVAMAARRYAERHLDSCAILRCLGASHAHIFQVYFWQISVLGIFASVAGCLFGYLAHQILCQLADRLILVKLPAPSAWPLAMGLGVGVIGLVGFALPPIYRLRRVPTLRVFRRELGSFDSASFVAYSPGVMTLCLLVLWQSGSWQLGWRVLSGILGTSLLLAAVAYGIVALLKRILPGMRFQIRFALLNIVRHRGASIVQLVAFGVGIMVLLLLGLVRTDLLNEWQRSLPANASNRFVVNIQPDQLEQVKHYFQTHNFNQPKFYPMVRARWTKLNGAPVQVDNFEEERARRLATREFNLSWTNKLQIDNKIVAGRWWGGKSQNVEQFSVEQGLANRLHMRLGDTLTFEVAGESITAKITSLRSVKWDTFHANFFVVTPSGMLGKFPASYITSFYLPPEHADILDNLITQFPNLTVIDISAVMSQVRTIMSRITITVEFVFLFTLLAGLSVMYAAIQATLAQRIRENAILRAIGASKRRLRQGTAVEFAVLGLLAGLLAAAGANIAGYVLAVQVFDLNYHFDAMLWLIGLVGGATVVGFAGILGTRQVWKIPPLRIIQNL